MEDKFNRIVLLTERYLNQIFGSIRVYREDSEFLIPWGSTVINVEVQSQKGECFLSISSPVALKVKPEKELMRFLLMENNSLTMCSFSVEFEKGLLDIVLGTKIKFDFINKELLSYVTINIGNLANEYCKEIIAVFGGLSFKNYIEKEKLKSTFKGEEKILHDIFELEGIRLALELYRSPEHNSYFIIGKVENTNHIFLKAERRKDIQEVFDFLEKIKRYILLKDIPALKKNLRHYELEEHFLYKILTSKEKNKTEKLKKIEKEINFLTDLLMKGEISHEEYKKRISDIERLIDL